LQDNTGSIPPNVSNLTQSPTPGLPYNFSRVLDTVLIPEPIYADGTLAPGARLLWGILRRLAHKTGQCFATEARLAAELAVNERQIRRYCRQLVGAGLLRETLSPGRATVRELLWHARFNGEQTANSTSGTSGENNRRRRNDGNRRPPRTVSSLPTPDENVRTPRTNLSTSILIDFLRGLLEADPPPPSATPPLNPPQAMPGGEEKEKVTSQGAPLDGLRPMGARSESPTDPGPLGNGEENLPSNVELHAGDRSAESIARFLRHSYLTTMDAEPGTQELNALVRILRQRRVDHIAYSLHMRHVVKQSPKPVTVGLWIKKALDFGQGVTAAELHRHDPPDETT
jgi:Helix-turn-helix domain